MNDNVIEAVTSFKNYMDNQYEIKASIEDYDISDNKVYVHNKLIGFTTYDENKNKFIGFKPVRSVFLRPRQSFTIGDWIKQNGVSKRIYKL